MIAFFGSSHFLVALALLATAVILRGPVAARFDIRQAKAPLELRAPLGMLDERRLAPYRVVQRNVLDSVVVEALGTDKYISWSLEDTAVSKNDPLRFASLLVTYDTGGHNLVPHTPDVCYLGAGYAPAQGHEDHRLELSAPVGDTTEIPVRVCTFVKTAVFGGDRVTVIYTFHCNGRFVSGRTDVRLRLNDLTNAYAYFSKVEVSFPRATREQSLLGAQKLFDRLLPVLAGDHFPDFLGAERAARGQPPGRS